MMKLSRMIVTITAICFIASAALAGGPPKPQSDKPEAQPLIDQAWDAIHVEHSAASFKKCTNLLIKADKIDPDNHTILSELSRCRWSYGNRLPKETDEQQEMLEGIYNQALADIEKSLELKETAAGHYWWAVNKASSLEFSSIFSQAAAFLSIKDHADTVGDIDETYYYGGSGRLWSEILTRVPKVVVKMVGYDVQEVVDDIDASITKEPRYVDNYVYKARFILNYYEDKDQALALLEQALKIDENVMPEEIAANRSALEEGRELWKTITGKDYPKK